MRVIWVFLFMFSGFCGVSYAWQDVSNDIPLIRDISGMEIDRSSKDVYFFLANMIYRSSNNGKIWDETVFPFTGTEINDIAVTKETMYASTDKGLFIKQEGKAWALLAGSPAVSGILVYGDSSVAVWSGNDIFLLKNGILSKIKSFPGVKGVIHKMIYHDGIIWAATYDELYYSDDDGQVWNTYGMRKRIDEENGSETLDEEVVERPFIRSLEEVEGRGIIVSTPVCIFTAFGVDRPADKISTKGLPSNEVINAVSDGENGIIAATRNKVFLYDGTWKPLFEYSKNGNIRTVKVSVGPDGKEWLWVVTENGVFKEDLNLIPDIPSGNSGMTDLNPNPKKAKETLRFKQKTDPGIRNPEPGKEPSIREVQQMAIEYAEVSPDKINSWRKGAKWKGIMPRLSLSYSRGINENIEIYKSASTSYVVRGPNEQDCDWGVDLTWDLADIVWNDAQTSIDVRSKLMVQLREEILEEVTRLYFERKRLIMELPGLKEEDLCRKRLRISELTAYLDAYTGGGFSVIAEHSR